LKTIKEGFKTNGSNICETIDIIRGTTAVTPLISHPRGAKQPRYIIVPMQSTIMTKSHLKEFRIFGISLKKLEFSFSLFVAPHCMSIEKKWARMAKLRWKERPPKNIANIGIHLRFSRIEAKMPCSAMRLRMIARVKLLKILKTNMRDRKTGKH
jgi:hypothetical protein